jgi:signal transduction histidine kinase
LHALSLATLVVVAMAFGVLQYRWIDEVSRAQETRERSRLREEARLIADALDTEITRAALVFTIPALPEARADDALEEKWAAWKRDAPWPRIVLGLRFLESQGGGWRTHSWGDPGPFDPRSIPRTETLVDHPAQGSRGGGAIHAQVPSLTLFIDGHPCLLQAIPTLSMAPGALAMNWILIRYDLGYLTETVLPRLLEEHSTAEDRSDYRFQIERKGPMPAGTVTVVEQFRHRPDCLTARDGGAPALTVHGHKAKAGGSASPPVDLPRPKLDFSVALSPSLLHAAGQCHGGPSPSNPGLLQVSVRRSRGGLSDVFTGFRRRNVLLSGLVMVVLLAALTALVVSTERARRLARVQTVVAAGISHELRTPLASLSVAADHLRNGHVEDVEQARRYGEIIEAQSRRLRHVVDQALALAGLSRPNRVPSRRAVSVSEIIDAASDGLAPRLKDAGIEIQRHTALDVPTISVDPDLLLRCLTNLIENSIKYAGSGRWVQVSARAGRQAGRPVVEVAVEDRGPGIRDDETTAVFEPFFRGSSARESRQPGSGLGLAIVKSAVEAQGGWIVLDRAVPHGCKFRLFLPADTSR